METRQLLRSALPLIGLGAIVAGALSGAVAAVAVLVGGACGLVHMVSLGRNVTALAAQGVEGARARLAVAYILRLLVSAAIIVALIQVLDPVPLLIGFGLVLLTATVFVGRGGLLVSNPTEGA